MNYEPHYSACQDFSDCGERVTQFNQKPRKILIDIIKSRKEKRSYSFLPPCSPQGCNFLKLPNPVGLESHHKHHYCHNLTSEREWSYFPQALVRKHKWKTSSDAALIYTQAGDQRAGDCDQPLPAKSQRRKVKETVPPNRLHFQYENE